MPDWVAPLIMKCTAADPAERFRDVSELIAFSRQRDSFLGRLKRRLSDTLDRAQGTYVKDDQSLLGGSVNRFRWDVVLLSAQTGTRCTPSFGTEAIRPKTHKTWFIIEYKTLSRIDRSKGKFRSFLLASLQNYLSNEADRARCLKRGGKAEFVYIDLEEAEDRYGLEPVEGLTPEKIFDARWAMALLAEAMNRLSREYMAQGKATTFQTLRTFLDPINSKRLPSYEEVAAQLEVSVGSLKTQIHRLRKQYTATVREEISRTVSDSADVDTETRALRSFDRG